MPAQTTRLPKIAWYPFVGNTRLHVFLNVVTMSHCDSQDRNTRVMGELSFQAAVSSTRLSRQAVVQFFQVYADLQRVTAHAALKTFVAVT